NGLWHGPEFPRQGDLEKLPSSRTTASAKGGAAARRLCRRDTKRERRRCPRECRHLDRQKHTANAGFRRWHAALPLGGLDRPGGLRHAERHVSAATNGKNVVFEGVYSTAATRSTAVTRSVASVAPLPTAASGCIPPTPPRSLPSSNRGA